MTPFCHCCHRLQALASCHEKLKKAASGEESFKNHRLSCRAKQSDPRCGRPISNLCPCSGALRPRDRKSTRLNSSHGYISYAVFCLKKKIKIVITSALWQSSPHAGCISYSVSTNRASHCVTCSLSVTQCFRRILHIFPSSYYSRVM